MSQELVVADYIDEAKQRLNAWGAEDWRQRQLAGFSRETLEQVMSDYRMIPRASGMRKEPERPDVVEVDSIVALLLKQPGGRDIVRALWLFHAMRKTEHLPAHDSSGAERDDFIEHDAGRLSQEEIATLMEKSRAQVRSWLERGWMWVAASLAHRP